MKGSDSFATAPIIPMGIICEPTPSTEMSPGREPMENYSGWGRSAWWRFTATQDVELSINLLKSTDPDGTWSRLFLWQGPALGQLDYVAWSEGNEYGPLTSSPFGDLPEITYAVTTGQVYHVQAILRDGYPDMTYVLQIGTFEEKVTGWLTGPEFEKAGVNPNFTSYGQRHWGNNGEWVEPEWGLDPNYAGYTQAMAQATAQQWEAPTKNGWIGPNVRVTGGYWGSKPNPESGPGQWPTLEEWDKYSGHGHSMALGHRRLSDVAIHYSHVAAGPTHATAYEFETGRPTVLAKMVTFTMTAESFARDGVSPANTTAKYQLLAIPVPPDDGTQTVNEYALFTPDLTPDASGPVIYETGPATTSDTFTIDMTPYMSAMGGTIVRAIITSGTWTPAEPVGNGFDYQVMHATYSYSAVTYTMRNPRIRYTYRLIEGDAELPEAEGRPDIVRRRFVG